MLKAIRDGNQFFTTLEWVEEFKALHAAGGAGGVR